MVQAYILIQTEVGSASRVAEEIRPDGVTQADDVTGPYDVIVRGEAESVDQARPVGRGQGAGRPRDHPHPDVPSGQPRLIRHLAPAVGRRWMRANALLPFRAPGRRGASPA